MQVNVKDNLDAFFRKVERRYRDQIPFATALALTKTAKSIQAAEVDEMSKVFDRPTRYTLGGTYVRPATKQSLAAVVGIKNQSSGGTPAAAFLKYEIRGGVRRHKRFELLLIGKGYMPSDMYAEPGADAKLDQYGNLSRALIGQILASLALVGPPKLGKRTIKRGGRRADYYVGHAGGDGRGPLGIWQRVGNSARPIVIYVRRAAYKPRFDFNGVAMRTARSTFEPNLRDAWAQAIR